MYAEAVVVDLDARNFSKESLLYLLRLTAFIFINKFSFYTPTTLRNQLRQAFRI